MAIYKFQISYDTDTNGIKTTLWQSTEQRMARNVTIEAWESEITKFKWYWSKEMPRQLSKLETDGAGGGGVKGTDNLRLARTSNGT